MQKNFIIALVLGLGASLPAYAQAAALGEHQVIGIEVYSINPGVISQAVGAGSGVDCDTGIGSCTFPADGQPQPAINFYMLQDQVVHIDVDIYAGLNCLGSSQRATGDLSLQAGLNVVYLTFDPPLPLYTELSLNWRVDGCAATGCQNYVIGQSPQICADRIYGYCYSSGNCTVPAQSVDLPCGRCLASMAGQSWSAASTGLPCITRVQDCR